MCIGPSIECFIGDKFIRGHKHMRHCDNIGVNDLSCLHCLEKLPLAFHIQL